MGISSPSSNGRAVSPGLDATEVGILDIGLIFGDDFPPRPSRDAKRWARSCAE